MSRLEPFRDGLWTVFQPLRFFGMEIGTRATIVTLPSGALAVISPVEFDEATRAEIDALGPVDYVIAPNLFHHLFYNQACELWPEARHLVVPGLKEKVPIVESALELTPEGALEDAVSWRAIAGLPLTNEHVFVSEPHQTLIITDLAFHFPSHDQLWLRMVMGMLGAYKTFGPSRLEKMSIKDKAAFGASLSALLEMDWDAIALPHGELIPEGGRALFEEGFGAYLPG